MTGEGGWRGVLGERVFARLWLRRVIGVAFGLLLAAWPVDVLWRGAISRTLEFDTLAFIGSAIGFSLSVWIVGSMALPTLGRSPMEALAIFVPILGGVLATYWFWQLAPHWRSKAQRLVDRDAYLEGLGAFEREVYRLRFDPDEDRWYSRRKVARILGATPAAVAEAESLIEARIEARRTSAGKVSS